MCINKYRLWNCTQKIMWFHILLARNTIFPFFAVTRSPATLSQQRMVLSCSTSRGLISLPGDVLKNGCITDPRPAWFDVPSTPTILSSSFVVDVDSCCVTHLIFLTTLLLTLEPVREPPTAIPTTHEFTHKLGYLLPRKQSYCSKLYCISWIEFPLHNPLPRPLPSHGHF